MSKNKEFSTPQVNTIGLAASQQNMNNFNQANKQNQAMRDIMNKSIAKYGFDFEDNTPFTPGTVSDTSNGHRFLLSKEGADNDYTTKNKAGSSAYGRFQFMPSTARMYAKRAGIDPNKWELPANQETIMNVAKEDYIGYLSKWGQDIGDSNQYAVHQLGPARARRYFSNTLTNGDISVMFDNLPQDLKNTAVDRDSTLRNWKSKYNY